MKHRKIISAIAAIGIASAACTMALGAFSADDITTTPAVTVYETTTEIVTTHPPYYTEIGPDVRKGTCSSGENIVWELSDDGTLTISGKGVLCDSPWQNHLKDDIKKVVIGEGITKVSLSSFALPSQVSMFRGCSNLESVVLPKSLVNFDGQAFADCEKLSSIDFPEGLEYLTLMSCPAIKSVTIPDTVTYLHISCCDSITELDIPDSVTTINSLAGNTSLKTVSLPSELTELNTNLFDGDISLENIILPEKLTVLPKCTFYNCTSLTSIKLPENLTKIGDNAFTSCSSLRSVVIPDNVTEIGREAFKNCEQLETITIPKSVRTIGMYAFENCPSLKAIRGYRGSAGFIKANSLDVKFIDLEKINYGDANCDGTVDVSDAVIIMQSLSNPSKYKLSEQGRTNGDCAGSGDGITNADALAIQKLMLQLVAALPVTTETSVETQPVQTTATTTAETVITTVPKTEIITYIVTGAVGPSPDDSIFSTAVVVGQNYPDDWYQKELDERRAKYADGRSSRYYGSSIKTTITR